MLDRGGGVTVGGDWVLLYIFLFRFLGSVCDLGGVSELPLVWERSLCLSLGFFCVFFAIVASI